MTDSSLKRLNPPNRDMMSPETTPARIATNIPPAPRAACPNPGSPSLTTWGVMMMRRRMVPDPPAMSRCLRKLRFSMRLNGMRKLTSSESIPIVHP